MKSEKKEADPGIVREKELTPVDLLALAYDPKTGKKAGPTRGD